MDSNLGKKVSIIIPCYNQSQYVAEAIESAIKQTYSNIEIVVINDGSTDNSNEIIKSIADKYKNILFLDEKENKGVITARNKAIETSSGEYILPLDADDIIEPTYVEKAAKILDENPKIGIVYSKARKFGEVDQEWFMDDFDKSEILYGNCIFCTALFRKSDFCKVGMYKMNMQHGFEDWDLWLSFLEQGYDVYRIDEILFNYRQYKEDSRTTICETKSNEVLRELISNHINLYLEDEQFIDIYSSQPQKLKRRYKKYKKLFNILYIVSIVEFVIILILVGVLCCA